MKRFVCRLAILLVSLISLPAIGQISMRSGAPFVAVRTLQQTTGDLFTGTGLVARSSNGSTYVELTTNGNTIILIQDIPHKRSIELIPKFHQYTIDPAPDLKAAVLLPYDPENYTNRLSSLPQKYTDDLGGVTTQIGQRKIQGLDVFGKTYAAPDGRLQEDWYCPKLDINLDEKMQANGNGPDFEITFTQVQVEEPDPKLFEIPAGYTQQEQNREMVGRIEP